MKNVRETLSNALVIGGLLATTGGAVDAVRTKRSSQETQQIQAITNKLRNEFRVREVCGFAGAPGSVVCSDHVNDGHSSNEEALILDEFRNQLSTELSQVQPDQKARRRLVKDTVVMLAGEVVSLFASIRKKKADSSFK